MTNRFKGLDLIDRVPEEIWTEVRDIVQEARIKTIPKKNKCKKAKWLSEEALQIAVNRREKVKSLSCVQLFVTPWTEERTRLRLFRPWDFPGKNTGVGCHFLLQEIFLTQGLNSGLPHCRHTLYHLSHQGSPKKSERQRENERYTI